MTVFVVINPVANSPVVTTAPTQRAPAKTRILQLVNVLFYEEGIRSVGVDRIISSASVTKATFYKHYRAKDNLIVEYMAYRYARARAQLEAVIAATPTPELALRDFMASIIADIESPGFRGCAFINAAAEFPQADHPVRRIITAHREWLTQSLADLLRETHHPVPGDAADELVLARDGALTGGYAGDSIAASAALTRIVDRLLADKAPQA